MDNTPRIILRGPQPNPYKYDIPKGLRRRVFERDQYTCVRCGSTENLCADHITPYSKGGLTTFENLQTLCRWCNTSKGDRI